MSKFRSQIFLSPVNGGLNMTNGLSTIPDTEGDVTIPAHLYYNYPLYWMLPESFLGDKVSSFLLFLSLSLSFFFLLFLRVQMKNETSFVHFEGCILRRIFKIYKFDGGWDTFEIDFSISDSATAGER